MPKSCLFDYGITFYQDGQIRLFPAAHALFQDTTGEWTSLVLLIDSGAPISALPNIDADLLGIELEQGDPLTVGGIGKEPLAGWRHTLRVRLGENELSLPVVFLDDPHAPRVLGREGIFDRFTVVLEEGRRRTGLIAVNVPEERAISDILDKV
jgi:hypothetical protein